MLFRKKPAVKPALPAEICPAEICGVPVRISARARRMALRVDARTGQVVLSLPARGVSEKSAEKFINASQDWIAKHSAKTPKKTRFVDGSTVCLLGEDYTISHHAGRGLTRMEDDKIIVHGKLEFLDRRVRDFLKKFAHAHLETLTREKCALIGKPFRKLRVADPKSRWGSCGVDGQVMFSWRLILTPAAVCDYVVAHEVAHLKHMNHGEKFWALCYSLCEGGDASRRWLARNGLEVMVT